MAEIFSMCAMSIDEYRGEYCSMFDFQTAFLFSMTLYSTVEALVIYWDIAIKFSIVFKLIMTRHKLTHQEALEVP